MSEAEVVIDAYKGALTVRGEQSFVIEVLEKYKSVFERVPVQAQAQQTPQHASSSPQPTQAAGAATGQSSNDKVGELSSLSNVFDVAGSDISILASPPGKNMTAQARSLILLYLYARHKLGEEPAPADAIKDQCKTHACYDPKNFAGHLKSQKSLVTVTGANSTMAARLTVPGRKAAEDLAQTLQNGQ